MRRLIITQAINATPAHAGFVASLRKFPGELKVIKGRYRNPTRRNEEVEEDWYDPAIVPYLTETREQLCPNLCLYADVPVQPTAVRPLSGFEVFCGQNSGILGHPKRALETIPSATRMPRILTTTGACTVPSYSDSKAGKKGAAHHSLGALVVEIEADGTYHLRHVSAGPKGDFVDLDVHYTPDGIYRARRAESLTLGDIHRPREEPAVMAATYELIDLLRPKHIAIHDVCDFGARNPHDRGLRAAFEKRRASVRADIEDTAAWLTRTARRGDHTLWVIDSNHDDMFDRWLNDVAAVHDPENHRYWCEVWARMYEAHARTGEFPQALELECRRLGVPDNVRFLGPDEPLVIKGIAHNFHGHVGPNGARPGVLAYAKLGCKTNTAHKHAPGFFDGNAVAGVTAPLTHGYNHLPANWLHAHIHTDFRGKRQLLIIVNGRFRA